MNVNWGLFLVLVLLCLLMKEYSLLLLPVFFFIGILISLFDKYKKEGLAFLLASGLGFLIWLALCSFG